MDIPKVGATVTMRATVRSLPDELGAYRIELYSGMENWSIRAMGAAFLTVENPPEPIKVGDRVRFIGRGLQATGIVVGLDGNEAWIKVDYAEGNGPRVTWRLTEIERIPSSATGPDRK